MSQDNIPPKVPRNYITEALDPIRQARIDYSNKSLIDYDEKRVAEIITEFKEYFSYDISQDTSYIFNIQKIDEVKKTGKKLFDVWDSNGLKVYQYILKRSELVEKSNFNSLISDILSKDDTNITFVKKLIGEDSTIDPTLYLYNLLGNEDKKSRGDRGF